MVGPPPRPLTLFEHRTPLRRGKAVDDEAQRLPGGMSVDRAKTDHVGLIIACMAIRFRLLTEADVKAVVTMDDLIETMASALQRFSTGRVTQPVRTVIPVEANDSFFG